MEGAKVKVPTVCDSLSALRPIQLAGGEQTLFAVTADGRVYATGQIECHRLRSCLLLFFDQVVGFFV